MGRHSEELQLCHELAASLTSAHEEAASLHRQARLNAQSRLEAAAAGDAIETEEAHARHWRCKMSSQRWQKLSGSEDDVDGAIQHQSMCRELRVAGARVPPKVLIAVSGFAAQSNTGVARPYIRDLLLFIDQAYCQQAQDDLEEALAQQHREVQRLTRKLVNAEPAAWVLQRQRVAHLERQLRSCTCRARRRLAERSGRDMLHFSVDKAFYLSREVDSLARENAKLREHARGKPVGAALALVSNHAKSDTLFSEQGASDTTLATSSAAQSSQKMDRAPVVVPTGIQAGTGAPFGDPIRSMDDPGMPERCWSSDQYLASTCGPARRVKGHERRPIKHGFEAPDDLLDTAIMEWQNLCESVSADVMRSEQDR
ncbi:g314 [Coccomyxa elongata]